MDEECTHLPCCSPPRCPSLHSKSRTYQSPCYQKGPVGWEPIPRCWLRPRCTSCRVGTGRRSILVHLNEIHRAVHPTYGGGDIEGHCEFAILQVEHLVPLATLIQHVQA